MKIIPGSWSFHVSHVDVFHNIFFARIIHFYGFPVFPSPPLRASFLIASRSDNLNVATRDI